MDWSLYHSSKYALFVNLFRLLGTIIHILFRSRQLQGLNINSNPSVLAIDDQSIAYVSGHNIIIYNIEKKTSQFIQGK